MLSDELTHPDIASLRGKRANRAISLRDIRLTEKKFDWARSPSRWILYKDLAELFINLGVLLPQLSGLFEKIFGNHGQELGFIGSPIRVYIRFA